MSSSSVYNSTDGPLPIDDEGRVLGGRERLDDVDVTSSPIAGHIEAGRFIVLEDQGEAPEPVQRDEDDDTEPPAPPVEATPSKRTRKSAASTPTQEA